MDRVAARLGGGVRGLVTTTQAGADAALIDALPRLEIIVCPGAHVDAIDRAAAARRGIAVTNAPGISAPDVADFAIAHLMAVAREIAKADDFVRAGHWLSGAMPFSTRVSGKTLGIVGMGEIGRIVARRAEGLDMTVCYHEPERMPDVPYRYFDDLVELARHVDFLSLHCHAGPKTRHLVDRAVLEALGPRGILINLARGLVVDEEALIEALETGAIAGAGLDVFENEPHVPERLRALTNVILSPHKAAFTVETKAEMLELAMANLRAHFAGKPLISPLPAVTAVGAAP
jgi:lactate dehydrogenase-like 2-hydroxyacid dehydrogenase